MMYHEDGSATFIGMERVVGRLGDRSGSFVLQSSGTYGDGVVKAHWTVVPESGTGNLRDLRGEGELVYPHGKPSSATLDYDVD